MRHQAQVIVLRFKRVHIFACFIVSFDCYASWILKDCVISCGYFAFEAPINFNITFPDQFLLRMITAAFLLEYDCQRR